MSAAPIFDSYAAIYESAGEEWVSLRLLQILRQWLVAKDLHPRAAADLACGTGAAAVALALEGLEVCGVDRSRSMLLLAEQRARASDVTITWLQQDLRALQLPRLVDLATAFYDSLNYLLSAGDLYAALARAGVGLASDGILAFDLNTPREYQHWDEGHDQVTADRPDLFVLSRRSFDPETRIGTGRVIWFARSGERWRRGEELHHQRAHDERELQGALAAASLSLRARLTLTGDHADEESTRILYIAQKD